MARFAAETAFQSDGATTAASRVSLALAYLEDDSQLALQHGLERWIVQAAWQHVTVPNRATREASIDSLIPYESTRVARFAAETAFQSDGATTAASRVSLALAYLEDDSQLTLQHGLERWIVQTAIVTRSRSKPCHTGSVH